jgi:hypothetical protein
MRGDGYYDERHRKDDPIYKLMYLTSVVLAIAVGVLATCYFQTFRPQGIQENTVISPAKRPSPSPATKPPDGSETNLEEKSLRRFR